MNLNLIKLLGISLFLINCSLIYSDSKVLYTLDFTNVNASDPRAWLKDKGFTKIESAAKDQNKLSLSFADNSLNFDTKGKIFAFILNPSMHIDGAKKIRITWGVNKFPDGGSYENAVRNEALMIYVYFGDKDKDSGSFFIPNCPYFLGLYLGQNDTIGKIYMGRHFTDGGRFICIGKPQIGATVVTEYNIADGFKSAFPAEKTLPFIAGIALEVETSSTGPANAFIKKIELLN
ncbi:MAG: hypothetical protein WCR55_01670 [Lentisphaerota bacterium]